MIDVHLVVQRQRMITRTPVIADARVPVDDQRVHAELMQPCRNRQPGLSSADDDDRGVALGKGTLLLESIGPVFRAEVAR